MTISACVFEKKKEKNKIEDRKSNKCVNILDQERERDLEDMKKRDLFFWADTSLNIPMNLKMQTVKPYRESQKRERQNLSLLWFLVEETRNLKKPYCQAFCQAPVTGNHKNMGRIVNRAKK